MRRLCAKFSINLKNTHWESHDSWRGTQSLLGGNVREGTFHRYLAEVFLILINSKNLARDTNEISELQYILYKK